MLLDKRFSFLELGGELVTHFQLLLLFELELGGQGFVFLELFLSVVELSFGLGGGLASFTHLLLHLLFRLVE